MKMKRWISMLLTLALCLGLLPGAALATEEGTESSLPEGYEQMYVEDNGNYVTVAEGTAGMGGDILFYVKLGDNYVALNETQQSGDAYAYTDGSLTVSCDAALGEAGLGRNGTNWRKGDAKPGASGYFYAVSGESKYAIEAKLNGNPNVIYDDIGNSEFTVDAGMEQAFTFPPTIYVDGVSKRLVAEDYNGETYTFATTIGSLYWHAEHDELGINTDGITSDTTGEITIKNTVSGAVYTCTVRVEAASGGDQGGSDEENPAPVLPEGYEQMYASYNDGTTFVTEIDQSAGGGGTQPLYVGEVRTPLTDEYSLTCTEGLGEVFWDENCEKLGWNAGDGIPGTSGYLYAEITVEGVTTKYAIVARVNAPNVGVYEDEACTKYLTTSDRTFEYDTENEANPVVYLAAGYENVTITGIKDDSEGKLSYTLPEGGARVIAVTPSELADGTFSAEVFVTLSNGREPSVRLNFEDETPPVELETGVYTTLTEGQLGGFVEMGKIYGDEGSNGYRVSYTTGQSVTVYYYYPNKTCSTTSNYVNITDVTVDGLNGVQAITLKENLIGTFEVGITLTNADGSDGGEFTVVFSDGYSQMYFRTNSDMFLDNIELAAKSSLILNGTLFSGLNGTLEINVADNYMINLSSDSLGNIVFPSDGNRVWDTSGATVGASGYLYVTKGEQKYFIEVSVTEPQPSGPVMLAPERPLEESDKRVIDWDTFDWDAVDTITYKGVTYCVGPLRTFPAGGITVLQPDRNGMGQGELRIGRCVGFYQPGPEGTIITPESSVIAELVAGFNGTLKLDLYAVTNPDSEYFKDYAKNYPATYAFNGFTDWPCRIAHYFSKGTDGRWLIEVTGTFTDENGNQTQVCTQATYTNENPPIEEYTATDLDDASEKLAQWAEENDPTVRYFLNLPQGKWTGTLVIPEGCDAFIRGNDKTTIVGGVQNDGGDVVIQGVQFIGAGKVDPAEGEHVWEPRGTLHGPSWRGRWESTYEQQWLKTWPKGSDLEGKPNYALYGTGSVQIQGCSFQGYLHVIHCAKDGYGQGVISGDINSTFRDNAVVYYLDGHSRGLANSDMLRSRFIRNGCVFWIDGYTRNQHTGVYRFLSCIFKENQIDAVNLSKRWFFMDHNFFMGKDAEGNDVIGPVFVGHNGNANKKETHVSAFPYAADEGFHELIYDKDAIMSSGKTSENKIPEEELNGMTITIIENDQEAAVWSFGEEE